MSVLLEYMTVLDPDLGVSRALGVARPASAQVCSRVETEVVRLFDEHRNRLLRYVLSIGLSVHDGAWFFCQRLRRSCAGRDLGTALDRWREPIDQGRKGLS